MRKGGRRGYLYLCGQGNNGASSKRGFEYLRCLYRGFVWSSDVILIGGGWVVLFDVRMATWWIGGCDIGDVAHCDRLPARREGWWVLSRKIKSSEGIMRQATRVLLGILLSVRS